MATGIFLEWDFFKDKSTTISEKVLLIEISNLSMLDLGCIANNNHFADKMGVKKEAISRLISSLEKKGFITSIIKPGSRNYSRRITINKMLFDPKQNVIAPLTNCLETKGNKTTNKTNNIYEDFLFQLKAVVAYKTKVTKTDKGEKLFKEIEDKSKLFSDYVEHQEEKKGFSVRITSFMEDYKTVYQAVNNSPTQGDEFIGGLHVKQI